MRPFLRNLTSEDPWERVDIKVPLRSYGLGSVNDFAWYFEGDSSVTVATIDDIQQWLLACEYVRDPDLFNEADFWQHPRTFEQIRRGDCEDHALWAWRKLIELGYDADLVAGRSLPWVPGRHERGHAWVVFRHEGETYLFETATKSRAHMVRPLSTVASGYRPEFGVDRTRTRFAYNGVLITMREREFGTGSAEPNVGSPSIRTDVRS
jgi:hypothetical protein